MLKKIVCYFLVCLSILTGMATAAHAALPVAVGTTIAAIQTDGQSVFDLVFPVIAVFVGLTVVVKLFKRWSNKV